MAATYPRDILAITGELRIVSQRLGLRSGDIDEKLGITAALIGGLLAATPGWGAGASSPCYSQTAIQAEQAIRYITDAHAASSACQNTTYAEFRLRKPARIRRLPAKALISHFHGEPAFATDGHRARQYRRPEAGHVNPGGFCAAEIRDADEACQKALDFDPRLRAHAYASQAAAAAAQYAECGGARIGQVNR